MKIARIENGAATRYPYSLRPDAKRDNPNVWPLPASWEDCSPELIASLGGVVVQEVPPPELQPGQQVREITPALVDGVWAQQWAVSPAYDPATQSVRWDGSQWVVEPLPPPPVPESVEPHKLAIVLAEAGVLAAVEALVAQQPQAVQIAWNRSPSIRRTSPMLEGARQALGYTSEQVDDWFRAADALVT